MPDPFNTASALPVAKGFPWGKFLKGALVVTAVAVGVGVVFFGGPWGAFTALFAAGGSGATAVGAGAAAVGAGAAAAAGAAAVIVHQDVPNLNTTPATQATQHAGVHAAQHMTQVVTEHAGHHALEHAHHGAHAAKHASSKHGEAAAWVDRVRAEPSASSLDGSRGL